VAPALFGIAWPDAQHLTVSFAPDGTNVGGAVSSLFQTLSSLFQTLNSQAATAVWEQQILLALQTWAVNGNINLSVVADNGAPFGQEGPLQGDNGFGDIRIGAVPLASDAVALGTPFDFSDTLSGNVLLDSTRSFGIGGQGQYDLFTTMLHEAGHVFGLPDNSNPASAMDGDYTGVRTGLATSDIAALQALYGARSPDAYEGPLGNSTPATATPINFVANPSPNSVASVLPSVVNADLSTSTDVDYYAVKIGPSPNFTVRVQTSGISLLTPRATVYDAAGNIIASASSTNPMAGDLTIPVAKAQAGATYTIRVESARNDVFGIGSYRLVVGSSAGTAAALDPVSVLNSAQATTSALGWWVGNGQSAHNTPSSATPLQPVVNQGEHLAYTTEASLASRRDVNDYQVVAPAGNTQSASLRVTVWGLNGSVLTPNVSVSDSNGQPVASQLIYSDAATESILIAAAVPGQVYTIAVSSASPSSAAWGGSGNGNPEAWPGSVAPGSYFLGVDFNAGAATTSGVLNQTAPQDFHTLNVARTGLVRFDLSAASAGSPAGWEVKLILYNSNHVPVFTLPAAANSLAEADVLLPAGSYTVRVIAITQGGQPLPAITYNFRSDMRSDPDGPGLIDPTGDPAGDPPPPTGGSSDDVLTIVGVDLLDNNILDIIDSSTPPW
jgi:hypothetical protein